MSAVKQKLEDLIKLKAKLLCNGIRPNKHSQRAYEEQNPSGIRKTGNTGLSLLLEGLLECFVSTSHEFNYQSTLSLFWNNNDCYLLDGENAVSEVSIIQMPNWYLKETSIGESTTKYFVHECSKYLHLAYKGCDLFANNSQCRFCSTTGSWVHHDPYILAEVVFRAISENPRYQVILSGGVDLTKSMSKIPYHQYISKIRQKCPEIPIWVEIAPFDLDYISRLIDLGADAFGLNLEFWDEEVRKRICPGKGNIPRDNYFTAFQMVTDSLGANKVGSVLIVGIEDPKNTKEGISALSSLGIRPNLLPFKPWDGSLMAKHTRTSCELLFELADYAASCMKSNNCKPRENFGCMNCPGCTVEVDCLRFLS